MLRRNDISGYAYKFTFSKTADTVGYRGKVAGTIARGRPRRPAGYRPCRPGRRFPDAKVDLDAIAAALVGPPASGPMDLGSATKEVQALSFRGILPRAGEKAPACPTP